MSLINIDINCDLGETLPSGMVVEYDHLLPWISSANVACGGHSGDPDSMRKAVDLCLSNDVAIGAHPSYADPVHFGRKSIAVSAETLMKKIQDQLGELAQICEEFGTELTHVKPHGALYVDCKLNEVCEVVARICSRFDLPLMIMSNPVSKEICESNGVDIVLEEFADRAYLSEFSLRSRTEDGALITNPHDLRNHLTNLLQGQIATDQDGVILRDFHTLCVHGDNPKALETLETIHQLCELYDIAVD